MDFQRLLKGLARVVFTALIFSQAICNIRSQISAGNAVILNGSDYVRTVAWSDALFGGNESFTIEFWFNADAPGVLVNETDTSSAAAWDVAFAEITTNGVIRAGAPNVPTITVGTVDFGS